MQHFAHSSTRAEPVCAQYPTALHALFAEYRDSLYETAAALGGTRGARLVARLDRSLAQSAGVTAPAQRLAEDLLDLFSLENVHDPDSDEAGFFAQIDPGSDQVHLICRLTDILSDALASLQSSRETV